MLDKIADHKKDAVYDDLRHGLSKIILYAEKHGCLVQQELGSQKLRQAKAIVLCKSAAITFPAVTKNNKVVNIEIKKRR